MKFGLSILRHTFIYYGYDYLFLSAFLFLILNFRYLVTKEAKQLKIMAEVFLAFEFDVSVHHDYLGSKRQMGHHRNVRLLFTKHSLQNDASDATDSFLKSVILEELLLRDQCLQLLLRLDNLAIVLDVALPKTIDILFPLRTHQRTHVATEYDH